jgi:hypothetical protein
MNGIISLKKHVDVDHFFIAEKFNEAIKVFLQLYQKLIIHTKIIYYNKIYICNIIRILLFNNFNYYNNIIYNN